MTAICARVARRAQGGERGQALVEYALILALVAIIAVAVVLGLGHHLSGLFRQAASCLGNAGGC